MKKLNTEIFITRAQKVQGEKYEYSKVNYVDAPTKINIICRLHGSFLQKPHDHLHGQGCPKCAGTQRGTAEAFIAGAQKVHGNLYEYSNVNYVNDLTKVSIVCKLHGPFLQSPNSHRRGQGCPNCGKLEQARKLTKTTEVFIAEAQKIHNNLYGYSKAKYVHGNKKVIIICKVHGQFLQVPNDHLKGAGCPICKNSKGEKLVARVLDYLNISYQREVSFPDLLGDINQLRFDFAVFKNNKLFCLIEYDGSQHFMYKKGFHPSRVTFMLQKKYDRLKDTYCNQHNIRLIRISYKVKDVEKYLKEHLN